LGNLSSIKTAVENVQTCAEALEGGQAADKPD